MCDDRHLLLDIADRVSKLETVKVCCPVCQNNFPLSKGIVLEEPIDYQDRITRAMVWLEAEIKNPGLHTNQFVLAKIRALLLGVH